MKDFRITDNRREAFIVWYAWSVFFHDCDPAVWCTNYLNNRFEHNTEQKYWLAWLYANTYQLPSAWVIMNEFPDFELATVDRLTQWNTSNYKRLRYQTDTKWNKGHLPVMFESYKKFIVTSQERTFKDFLCLDNERQHFDVLWKVINTSLYKFGRYSTWFYMQHLKHTCNLPIEPTSLMLHDHDGSRSHRTGLLYALGMDDKLDKQFTLAEYDKLECESLSILHEARERYPQLAPDMDYFTMETCLCSFKKLFRKTHGRYLGYYLDRQSEEIKNAEKDGWDGIDWNVLWQARKETLDKRLAHDRGVNDNLYSNFLETGQLYRSEMLPGQPDVDNESGALGEFWS